MANATHIERCRFTMDPLWICNCTECANGRKNQPWRYRQPSQTPASRSTDQPTITP